MSTNSCFDAPSAPHIQGLGRLTIEHLVELETLKVASKALHNEAPVYIKELFLKLSETRCKELLISSTDLCVPSLRTSVG